MRNITRGTTRHGALAGLMIGSVLLGGGMFLAGCSAGSSNSAASVSGPAAEAAGQGAGQAAGQANAAASAAAAPRAGAIAGGSGAQGGSGTTARLAPASSIIYTAQLTVRAGNVSSAAAQAAEIAEGVGGYVSNETASSTPITRPRPPPAWS